MRFEDWEPIYHQIINEFGFSRSEDERAAQVLDGLLADLELCDEDCIARCVDEDVTVCGDSATLGLHLRSMGTIGRVISADGATRVLMDSGIRPDMIVTDLDGDIDSQVEANRRGSVAVVHAHGDNIAALEKYVRRLEGPVAGTTQSMPFGRLHNFGGFTDGDRAVALARHFGAKRIRLLGFDFKQPKSKEGREGAIKARKLEWARAMIFDLNPPGTCLSIP